MIYQGFPGHLGFAWPRPARPWEYWRSDAEKAHVYAQFDEARATYPGPGMRERTARNLPGDASGFPFPPDTLAI